MPKSWIPSGIQEAKALAKKKKEEEEEDGGADDDGADGAEAGATLDRERERE